MAVRDMPRSNKANTKTRRGHFGMRAPGRFLNSRTELVRHPHYVCNGRERSDPRAGEFRELKNLQSTVALAQTTAFTLLASSVCAIFAAFPVARFTSLSDHGQYGSYSGPEVGLEEAWCGRVPSQPRFPRSPFQDRFCVATNSSRSRILSVKSGRGQLTCSLAEPPVKSPQL